MAALDEEVPYAEVRKVMREKTHEVESSSVKREKMADSFLDDQRFAVAHHGRSKGVDARYS